GMRMLSAIVIGVIIVVLAGLLVVLFRGIDLDELRAHPQGIVSVEGLAIVVGLGFLLGLGYGLLLGRKAGGSPWIWMSRGFIDGLVMACAATFYVGIIHRKQRRLRRAADESAAPGEISSGHDGAPDG
ncbi:MAG: hypothetical protein MUQ56_11055, partial [Thermoleophilia bacterium]|nr:hypothetical protein [Thermoleophilia bacterium]